jgi:hypothetical protein
MSLCSPTEDENGGIPLHQDPESFRSLRKFCQSRRLSLGSDIPRAKSHDGKFAQFFFGFLLRAFASLREIFRFLVAALPRWNLHGFV